MYHVYRRRTGHRRGARTCLNRRPSGAKYSHPRGDEMDVSAKAIASELPLRAYRHCHRKRARGAAQARPNIVPLVLHIKRHQAALDVAGNPDPRSDPEIRLSLRLIVALASLPQAPWLTAFTDVCLIESKARALDRAEERCTHGGVSVVASSTRLHHARQRQRTQAFRSAPTCVPKAPLDSTELSDRSDGQKGLIVGANTAQRMRGWLSRAAAPESPELEPAQI